MELAAAITPLTCSMPSTGRLSTTASSTTSFANASANEEADLSSNAFVQPSCSTFLAVFDMTWLLIGFDFRAECDLAKQVHSFYGNSKMSSESVSRLK